MGVESIGQNGKCSTGKRFWLRSLRYGYSEMHELRTKKRKCYYTRNLSLILTTRRGGGGGTYKGLYGETPPERGTFFTLQVYERVGISRVEVYQRVGKSVIKVFKRAFHYFPMEGIRKGYHLSMEGVRKGYLFCQKWYEKG